MPEPVIARLLRVAAVGVAALWPAAALAQQIPLPAYVSPSRLDDPQRLQMPRRAPLTIVPSVTVAEEYNDNITLSNANRDADFITIIQPGIAVSLESATYRLAAGYSFSADMYANEPGRNSAFDRQNFDLDTQWRPTEQLTLTLLDTFVSTTNTNLLSPEGVATGGDRAWSNSIRGGAAYRLNPFTTLRGGGSYTVQRYDSAALADVDSYTADVGLDRVLSRTLTGTLAYEAAYFDIEFEPTTWTHTPRVGLSYRLAETITVSLSGGPSFEIPESGSRDSRVTPAITAAYEQRIFFGAVRVDFDRRIGVAAGIGGPTDNTSVGGRVDVLTLMRGLTLSLGARYVWVESPDNRVPRIDIQTFTMPLTATYRITAWIAAVAGYQFYRQRTGDAPVVNQRTGQVIAEDADQNRVFVGLQFGYPFTFDRP
jgi:hypothetical protein